MNIQRRFQVKHSYRTGGVSIGLVNGSPNRRSSSVFCPTRSLERFADNSNIHGISPPTFRLSLIATVLQKVPSLILRASLSAIPFV